MISKKLLSEVLSLKYPIRIIHHFCKGQNALNYDLHVECALFQESINIYELAHRCKEWAYRKGYSLISGVFIVADDNGNAVFDYFNSCLINYIEKENRKQVLNNFKSDTELEAIFKACEWIIEQTKCQNNNSCKTISNKKSL